MFVPQQLREWDGLPRKCGPFLDLERYFVVLNLCRCIARPPRVAHGPGVQPPESQPHVGGYGVGVHVEQPRRANHHLAIIQVCLHDPRSEAVVVRDDEDLQMSNVSIRTQMGVGQGASGPARTG